MKFFQRANLLVFVLAVYNCNAVSYREMDAFYANITRAKNTNIRPVLDHKDPVHVHVFFHLICIQGYDEVDGNLGLTGYFGVYWKDKTISWNASENGIDSITFTDMDLLWTPNFIIGDPYEDVSYLTKDDTVKRVTSEGVVSWNPGGTFHIVCNADVSQYPFDTQICLMKLLPWGYSATEINVSSIYPTIVMDWYKGHKTWDIVETDVSKVDSLQMLRFNLRLKRHPMFFVLNLIMPIFVMSVLNIFVFFIPPESGDRLSYSVTVLLAIAVFLTISSDNLPATSTPRLSTISLLLFAYVTMSAAIVILVILSLRFYHRDDKIPVSTLMRRFVKTSRLIRCKTFGKKENLYILEKSDNVTWTDVGVESDFWGGLSVSLIIIVANVFYTIDIATNHLLV